jgi:broad specificity phosphatase PhoE
MMTDRFVSLLRHGEVQGGARFRGAQDDPLAEIGWAQMRLGVAPALAAEPPPGRILASTARRCADFARALAAELALPLDLSDAFAERRFGAWEGLGAAEIPAGELAAFWSDPVGCTPPGAEPFGAFRARVLAGWGSLLAQQVPHALVIAHGGVIRAILAETLDLADRSGLPIEVPPASLTRLRLPEPPGRPSLIAHGV